jgi:hypothetical protein
MKYIITILFFLLSLTCLSQPSITWSKYYIPLISSSDEAKCIKNTGTGFYYVSGHSSACGFILKINEFGDSIWGKFLPEINDIATMVIMPDKGCIISGHSDSLPVVRLDSNGNVLWSKNYINNFVVADVNDIKRTSDGFIIGCGIINNGQQCVVFKINENGSLIWMKTNFGNYIRIFHSIEETLNNGYIIAGDYGNGDSSKIILLKLDTAGNTLWEKQYRIFNVYTSALYLKRTETGYFIAGRTMDTSNVTNENRLYFIRTDTEGNIINKKYINFYKDDYYYSANCINDNKFIFSSFTYSPGSSDTSSYSKVIVLDSTGNITASRNFIFGYYYGFYAISGANIGNDLLLAGSIKLFGNDDFLVCRVNNLLQGPPIGIKPISSNIPNSYNLYQNYPNPFNPETKIRFSFPPYQVNDPARTSVNSGRGQGDGLIKVVIFDLLGREITTLINQRLIPGTYEITWDASGFASGIYFYSLQMEDLIITRKMCLIK